MKKIVECADKHSGFIGLLNLIATILFGVLSLVGIIFQKWILFSVFILPTVILIIRKKNQDKAKNVKNEGTYKEKTENPDLSVQNSIRSQELIETSRKKRLPPKLNKEQQSIVDFAHDWQMSVSRSDRFDIREEDDL